MSLKRFDMATGQTNKNLDIEVLRAIAVTLVLVDHVKFLIPWPGITDLFHITTSMWGGVDIFFAISGFVITSLFLREAPEKHFICFSIPFWIRRIYRIWPSAMFWVCIPFIASLVSNKSGAFGSSLKGNYFDIISTWLQVANLHWYHCTPHGQGDVVGTCGVNTIYWSLSLEEQFYLVFPFLFFFLSRYSLKCCLVGVIVILFFIPRSPPSSFLWWIRTDALAWGALIALIRSSVLHKALEPTFLASGRWAIGTSVLLVALVASFGTSMVVPFHTGIIALLSGIFVLIASYDKNYIFPAGIFRSILLWAGSRSYALYLTHQPAYFLTREIFTRIYKDTVFDDRFIPRFVLLGVFLTITLAEANFRLLETPLRKKGKLKAAMIQQRIATAITEQEAL